MILEGDKKLEHDPLNRAYFAQHSNFSWPHLAF